MQEAGQGSQGAPQRATGLLLGAPGAPHISQQLLITQSVRLRPGEEKELDSALPAQQQPSWTRTPKPQPFLAGTSEPVRGQGEGTGLLSRAWAWSQGGISPRATVTVGAVRHMAFLLYTAWKPCADPPPLWEWGTCGWRRPHTWREAADSGGGAYRGHPSLTAGHLGVRHSEPGWEGVTSSLDGQAWERVGSPGTPTWGSVSGRGSAVRTPVKPQIVVFCWVGDRWQGSDFLPYSNPFRTVDVLDMHEGLVETRAARPTALLSLNQD